VDRVALGQVFSEYFGFSFHRLLHTLHHLPSGAGTIGQIVAGVPSGLSPTKPQEITEVLICLFIPAESKVIGRTYERERERETLLVIIFIWWMSRHPRIL
jgi:hypothetical protein